MARKRNQADHRADLRGGPFIGLPTAVVFSSAYTGLSLAARAVLTEILARFNGYNNGLIGISSREICARLGTTNARRVLDAIADLLAAGFIDIAIEGKWHTRQARRYRLTFITSGKAPPYQSATNDYAKIPHRAFSRVDETSAGKPRFAKRASAGTLGLADPASAATNAKPPFGGLAPADTASTVIRKPYQVPFLRAGNPDESNSLNANGPSSTIVAGRWPNPTCEACGNAFAPGDRGKPKRFCSEPCRKRAETQRRSQRSATRH